MAYHGKTPEEGVPFTFLSTDLKDFNRRLDTLDIDLTALGKILTALAKQVQNISIPTPVTVVQPSDGRGLINPSITLLAQYTSSVFQDEGVATGGDNSSLIDTVKNWAPSLWNGSLLVMALNGQIYIREISSNINNSVSFGVLPGNVNITPGTPYVIKAAPTTGVKIATQVINLPTIAAATTSTPAQCVAVDLSGLPMTMAITVEAIYDAIATRGILVHIRSSNDNLVYDTEDWDTLTPNFAANTPIRQTADYDVDPYGIKILVENLDPARPVTGIKVFVTIGA